MNISTSALVLEGGGIRGIFTAGILDYFIEQGVEFPYVIGVSAGATNAISYLSKQKGRNLYADTTLMQERKYIGLRVFLRKGVMIDMDLLFEEFPRSIYPFDWDCFAKRMSRFEMITTNIITGEPCYFDSYESMDRLSLIARATSSLPFINKEVYVDNTPMLDGGLVDSIPLKRALEQGYDSALVILTQCYGFRKKESRVKIPLFLNRKYPKVVELLNSRTKRYNEQLAWVEELEKEGKITVLRPTKPLEVGRLCSDTEKIKRLYKQGYETAQRWLQEIKR